MTVQPQTCCHAQAVGGVAKKRLDTAVGWFKGLGAATQSLVAGRGTTDAAEDPEYIKVIRGWHHKG